MQLETQLIRLTYGKSLHPSYPGGVAGKFSRDKAEMLIKNWLSAIERDHESMIGTIEHFGFGTGGAGDDECEVTQLIHAKHAKSV